MFLFFGIYFYLSKIINYMYNCVYFVFVYF